MNSCRGELLKLHWSLNAVCGIISKKTGIETFSELILII